jgi:hypothetical protein
MTTGEVLSYEKMETTAKPVLGKEIAAPAPSWTPSERECLEAGKQYVWYVQSKKSNGKGQWSGGKVFEVDVTALSQEMDEAAGETLKSVVEKTVDSYLTSEVFGETTLKEMKEKTKSGTSGVSAAGYEGSSNTCYGLWAGMAPDCSGDNDYSTFVGTTAGNSNTSGSSNTFVGYWAGVYNTVGHSNTFLGRSAGQANNIGNSNTFVGSSTGASNTSGESN